MPPPPLGFIGPEQDSRYLAYVGWDRFAPYSANYQVLFSEATFKYIQDAARDRLAATGFTINVAQNVVGNVLSNLARNNNPVIGDIFTRYSVPNAQPRNDVNSLIEQAINVIVNSIMDEIETTRLNQRLSIWSTVYGDFNQEGLRAHSIIRRKENDYMKGMFSMNY